VIADIVGLFVRRVIFAKKKNAMVKPRFAGDSGEAMVFNELV
jgi:hypothetical protein